MSMIFNDAPKGQSPDIEMGFSGNQIESHVELRSKNCLSAALDNKKTKYLAINSNHALHKSVVEGGSGADLLLSAAELAEFKVDYSGAILMGDLDGLPVVALGVKVDHENLLGKWELMDTRTVMVASGHNEAQAGAYAMAISLMNWHASNQYCGVCGEKSVSRIGGMRRDCDECETKIFPRTDPAVIMLAVKDDRCLLGRSPHFPEHWYSCLAGFVEPGESIEKAVRRETREESGIEIGRVKYYASQPWPFPHSIMIGCYCEAISETISFDGDELEDCRWFDRSEVLTMIEKRHAKELRAPPSKSIAAHLIRNWLEPG